jgi:aryl-alcohol dehydrogenase-like predicted oxidoreductase
VEEVMSTLGDLVTQGKIRYFGLSDTPAWYAARAQTLAETSGGKELIALQLEYSLVERNIEREHIPVAQELGLGLCPWSPLAAGFLSGKYQREGSEVTGTGRLGATRGAALFDRFKERNWRVLDVLRAVAQEMGRPPAQVALNWVCTQPGVTSTITGAMSLTQLETNLGALNLVIPEPLRARLNEVTAPEPIHPYVFYGPRISVRTNGIAPVEPWSPARVTGAADPPAVKTKTTAAD